MHGSVCAEPPTGAPGTRDLIEALIGPSLIDDGILADAEVRAIRQVAQALLSSTQLDELERQIALHAVSRSPESTRFGPERTESTIQSGHWRDTTAAIREAPENLAATDSPRVDQGFGPCCDGGGLLDNLSLFLGLEGSKQPQDFGVNAHFGGRFAANWGMPLVRDHGVGVQIGTSINYTDNAVQVFERIEGTTGRFQSLTTVGVFQRTAGGLVWGAGYDFLFADYFDEFYLGQWRGTAGYALNCCDEFGVRVAISDKRESGSFGAIPVTLDPITQGSLYWRHTWESLTETSFWVGIAEGHGEANVALGDRPPVDERLVFGADIHVPLTDRLALFGEANFITPADTGTVDAYLGVVYYPAGGAHYARKRPFAPVLPVASNPSFSVDLAR
jgi:hypothetical protein